ncbi:MAG: adenosine deaminase [Fimbriimonas sp.]|nr:adenosine deaminase [Fimbriimonas sp.]
MVSLEFCRRMPKVELHVHLEGSIRPETVLKLAQRHDIKLPAADLDGLREWYKFRDFPHFVEIYVSVSKCLRTADDIELIAREFLQGQAEQNIWHSEATYSATTIEKHNGIPWPDQHAALKRALEYGRNELGISANFILDIVRGDPAERALELAHWVVGAKDDGVCALGLAGIEGLCPASEYAAAYDFVHDAGMPVVPHAGETKGAESMIDVIQATHPVRIGHGVRCLENADLVKQLREIQMPLEVNPSSNVCLGVFPSMDEHPLPNLLDEGLYVTINSDDPPMFGTSLSEEYYRCAQAFGFSEDILWSLSLNAANAALLPAEEKRTLARRMSEGFPHSDEEDDN